MTCDKYFFRRRPVGATKIIRLFEKLTRSHDMVAVTLCQEVQTLYISILKGRIGAGEIDLYIQDHAILARAPQEHRDDFSQLLDLISAMGAT
jgi:hypothetical protein